jgi:hypothetical protein
MHNRAKQRAILSLLALLTAAIATTLLYRPITRAFKGARQYELKMLKPADKSKVQDGVSELVSLLGGSPRTATVLAKTSLPPAVHWEGRIWVRQDARQVFRRINEKVSPGFSPSYGDQIFCRDAWTRATRLHRRGLARRHCSCVGHGPVAIRTQDIEAL